MSTPFRGVSALLEHQLGELDLPTLERVRRMWPAMAGSAIHPHTQIVALRGGVLVVYADSPVWANAVRHRIPDFLAAFRRQDSAFNELRVRVHLETASSSPPDTRNPTRISGSTAKLLRETAEGLSDPALRASLLRLSAHESDE